MAPTNYNPDTDVQGDQDLEELRRNAFEYFETKVFSVIAEMPKLAEAFSTIRDEELFRLAGHTDFHEYIRTRFGVPPHFAVLVEEFFGEAKSSTGEEL